MLPVQDKSISEVETALAVRPPGTEGAVASTVTVVSAVVVPLLSTAVRVNKVVVESAGVVVDVPLTVPIPRLMDSVVAPETDHESVDVPLRATAVGEAEKEAMDGTVALLLHATETLVTLAEATVPEPLLTAQVWPEGWVRTVTL